VWEKNNQYLVFVGDGYISTLGLRCFSRTRQSLVLNKKILILGLKFFHSINLISVLMFGENISLKMIIIFKKIKKIRSGPTVLDF